MHARAPRPRPRHVAIWVRHLANFGPLAVIVATAFYLALGRVAEGVPPAPRAAYAALVALNILPAAMSSWCAVLGAWLYLSRRSLIDVAGLHVPPPSGAARVAIVFAMHEEDAAQVFSAARAIADDVAASQIGAVDLFLLSDSREPASIAAEEAMLARASRRDGPRLFYRRRGDNKGRKAGNIADFVRSWGRAYDFMVVLDADSLMTAACIGRLVGAMEANPRAGLIQAMCYPVGRLTTFARIQQFDARLIGPVFQAGAAFWQGSRGNFWGHNAIIRCDAFAASCGLPELSGRPPFGGEILSHDTVEAALLLRRGYEVWMMPAGPDGRPDGSWEETPTNVADHLARDRRWLRGNLQHGEVLAASGLKVASLYHLIRGLAHFLYAPLLAIWLLAYLLLDRGTRFDGLVVLVAALVTAPRLLGLVAALSDDDVVGFGGRCRLIAGAAASQAFAAMIFPIVAASHLVDLAGMLVGGMTRWEVQSRSERGLAAGETARVLLPALVVAAIGAVASARAAPLLSAWIGATIVAAVPLAVLTSRIRHSRLFETPEDAAPHPLRSARRRLEALLRAGLPVDPGAKCAPLPARCGLEMPMQSLRLATPIPLALSKDK